MKYPKSEQYDKQFLLENMMGPNALKILEELTEGIKLTSDMKILDLGCGKGLTSIFLAKEFGVQVYATDLWITAAENFERFKKLGLEDRIIPIHANALDLPYAENYFDAVISVDSYHYFGNTPEFMDTKLAPYIKPNGIIALAFPGFKKDYHNNLPSELLISWGAEDLDTFHSCKWWHELLSQSQTINIESISELKCMEEAWQDWLECDEEHAINAILSYYAQIAENAGTTLEIQAQMEKEIPVPEPEFCVLLGNLLENAVDACRENKESGAIKVHIRQTGTSLIAITVDNPCRKPPVLEGKRFLSTKHSGPGIGTQSIRLIAERHRGDARFEWKNGMFYASVILIPSAES